MRWVPDLRENGVELRDQLATVMGAQQLARAGLQGRATCRIGSIGELTVELELM
jgi:hypothetical protein